MPEDDYKMLGKKEPEKYTYLCCPNKEGLRGVLGANTWSQGVSAREDVAMKPGST